MDNNTPTPERLDCAWCSSDLDCRPPSGERPATAVHLVAIHDGTVYPACGRHSLKFTFVKVL